ncbi:unnamed protein product [Didymodactylos carnosus]|uniref:Transposase n=1 Tax=Didymodactylos carnosus TaxID=1234261 RepID=A0A8S2IQZ4_9BILA|nr:unnamed protein product [Didymodactylos carnosus]CAF3766624.1 unnamed protein product [Didymodactylos carnosus]
MLTGGRVVGSDWKTAFKQTRYFSVGGKNVYDVALFIHFTHQVIVCRATFRGYTSAYNATIYDLSMMQDERTSAVQQTFQPVFLDRQNFQSAFLVFGVCQFKFFMNNSYMIEIPFSLDKVALKRWCEGIKKEMWKLFVIMWGNHKETRKCGSSTCSSCFVVDGQQKIDRPICRFKNVIKENYELGDVFVGCGETSIAGSHFCDTHSYIGGTSTEADGMILEEDNDCLDNPVSDCNMSRIEPETNDKRLTIKLPRGMMYDNACSLKLFIDKHFDQDDHFKKSTFSDHISQLHMVIDRFHQVNHTRHICNTIMRAEHESHGTMFRGVNGEIAEQMFSWLKGLSTPLSGYSSFKSQVMLTLLFHYKNCRTINVSAQEIGFGRNIIEKYLNK